jgi:uncharacterized protein DUF6299
VKATKFLILLLAITSLALGSTPALAAGPPSNDKIAGATTITALPFSDAVDTTKANTDADETAAGQPCRDFGAPAIEKAVWYRYTAPSDVTLLVDTSASSYTTGIAAYSGTPSALRISVQEAPPPPEVSLTVDPVGTFDPKSGNATVSGTVTCTGVADFTGISGDLTQTVGRFTISGFFFSSFACDGTTQSWTATVTSSNGRFGGGQATVRATAFACNQSGCGQDSVTQQVRLKR